MLRMLVHRIMLCEFTPSKPDMQHDDIFQLTRVCDLSYRIFYFHIYNEDFYDLSNDILLVLGTH